MLEFTSDEIPNLPELLPDISRALEEEKLIVFLGAGISRLIGCIGWGDLAKNLVNKAYQLQCITYREKETLELDCDHKKTISLCYYLLRQKGFEQEFFIVFNEALEPDSGFTSRDNIYKQLIRLRVPFVTTNADLYFTGSDFFLQERIHWDITHFNRLNIDAMKLFLIHGIQNQPHSLVFTVDRYIKRYNDPQFIEFLKCLFKQFTISN